MPKIDDVFFVSINCNRYSNSIESKVVYERVREDVRAEMEANAVVEMEVKHQKMCEELDGKAEALDVKQKHVDEKYENFEKMFFEFPNMRES
ncbi:hypothetical protein LXL04_003154 [Taraxacum kok-saghyz]